MLPQIINLACLGALWSNLVRNREGDLFIEKENECKAPLERKMPRKLNVGSKTLARPQLYRL